MLNNSSSIPILTLAPHHAALATQLHIAGQPGTFLTTLGPAVLQVFYQALPQSAVGFGFVAATAINPTAVVGFVAATTSTGRLFAELGTRHLPHFLPPLLRRFAQRPTLIGQAIQTLVYPFLHHQPAHGATGKTAELLAIMVEPAWRSHGIGAQLMASLVEACQARGLAALAVTVDAANLGAQRFYVRHGFREQRRFSLYGRAMLSYQLTLDVSATRL